MFVQLFACLEGPVAKNYENKRKTIGSPQVCQRFPSERRNLKAANEHQRTEYEAKGHQRDRGEGDCGEGSESQDQQSDRGERYSAEESENEDE